MVTTVWLFKPRSHGRKREVTRAVKDVDEIRDRRATSRRKIDLDDTRRIGAESLAYEVDPLREERRVGDINEVYVVSVDGVAVLTRLRGAILSSHRMDDDRRSKSLACRTAVGILDVLE